MNKYIKIIIAILIVVAVFVFSFLVTGKKSADIISYEDYTKIVEKGGYVYYGKKENQETLKQIADDSDIEIGILDSDSTKTEKLKEGTFYKYEDGKVKYKYTGDVQSYKFKKYLAENGIYNSYITVSIDDYEKIIKEDGYNFMFIGSEQCGYCTKFKESIKESLKDYNYAIYYIDIASLSENEYNRLAKTDKYMSENEWGTPLNLLYKDGKRVKELSGYVPTEELNKFLKENKVI